MSSRSNPPARLAPALSAVLLSLLLLIPTVRVRAAEPPSRREMTQAIFDTLKTGDWHHALSMLEAYNARYRDDGRMLYNQACLENRAGNAEQALGTLKRALDAGFEEMGFAMQDPDLEGIADDPRLFQLTSATADSLGKLSRIRKIRVRFDTWSGPIRLETADGEGPSPEVRLRWQQTGLRVQVATTGPWDDYARSGLPPWAGGAGIVATLAVPDSTEAFVGGNTFTFACGYEKGGPTAAQFLPGVQRWQRIVEMDPKLDLDPQGRKVLAFTIPWQAVMPFHPLADPHLGLNIQVRRDSAHGYAKAYLMPDPWAWAPWAAHHRFVPLDFDLSSLDRDLFMGRVSDSISGNEPVDLRFTVISAKAGQARLTIGVQDPATHTVLPGGPRSETIELVRGVNSLVRQVDFRGLRTGAYLVRTGLRFPSGGDEATWSTSVLRFAPGWREDLEHRIAKVPAQEQPTLERLLVSVTEALAAHLPRRDPGPIATTVQDLQSMLNQATATGSILPDHGPVTMVYPGADGSDRLCTLYLTPVDSTAHVLPVLILHQAAGHEGYLVERIARNHEHGDLGPGSPFTGRPVYIVPHVTTKTPSLAEEEAEARTCLSWVLDYLGAGRALGVGIDGGAGPLLELAMNEPGRLSRVLVFAGQGLDPWPHLTEAELALELAPPPPVPVTWIDFPLETEHGGRGPMILELLRQAGWQLTATTSVQGGLSLSQAADRLVLWTMKGSKEKK